MYGTHRMRVVTFYTKDMIICYVKCDHSHSMCAIWHDHLSDCWQRIVRDSNFHSLLA